MAPLGYVSPSTVQCFFFGHSAGFTHFLPCSTVPCGQKQPDTHIGGQNIGCSSIFSHVMGQAVPHSLYTLSPGHL